ncbi:DUF417 family protein [Marinobacter mobilis]|uniref:Uncharacterized membrane protein YkgB n=1 Tax=Marinobacter mobilis TaxID=488533 RepID=A0A1H3BW60_9GAMM|nr:DUF417 family protein [Marinobacter mobilis]SDX45868.1 Uncharacterized membrane protein YkgB [Marinobacter mobilis]
MTTVHQWIDHIHSTLAPKALYFSLVIVFLWFGLMKFSSYEAQAIEGLVANSPFLKVLYHFFSVQVASAVIGTIEVTIAVLLSLRFFLPKLAAIGAAGAVVTFLLTLTLFLSTPGVFLPDVGPAAISVVPGQFLLKDLTLLAASFWALGNSLKAAFPADHS